MKCSCSGHFSRLPKSSCLCSCLSHYTSLSKLSNYYIDRLAFPSISNRLLYCLTCYHISEAFNSNNKKKQRHTFTYFSSLSVSLSRPYISLLGEILLPPSTLPIVQSHAGIHYIGVVTAWSSLNQINACFFNTGKLKGPLKGEGFYTV